MTLAEGSGVAGGAAAVAPFGARRDTMSAAATSATDTSAAATITLLRDRYALAAQPTLRLDVGSISSID